MFRHQVALDCLSQPPGVLDAHAARSGRAPLDFDDVARMTRQTGRQAIQLFMGLRQKDRLTAAEDEVDF